MNRKGELQTSRISSSLRIWQSYSRVPQILKVLYVWYTWKYVARLGFEPLKFLYSEFLYNTQAVYYYINPESPQIRHEHQSNRVICQLCINPESPSHMFPYVFPQNHFNFHVWNKTPPASNGCLATCPCHATRATLLASTLRPARLLSGAGQEGGNRVSTCGIGMGWNLVKELLDEW